MIDRNVIEEIKYRSDIEDVISGYVSLKRAGSNMLGLCPFHSEKTPSFTVFPNTQNFYCFGCGAGGDVITFIMRSENLEYPDAVEFLAKRAGIDIPAGDGREAKGPTRTRILEMNLEAARFFHAQLYSPDGAPGMEYLKDKRKLTDATIRHFGLGYAPQNFGALTDCLKKKGYTEEEMITGFLCGRSQKTGRAYDYFRGRVMFPIIDVAGNVVAFGGRVLDDSLPKYLNSSDTPAFKKSRNLFALNYAKNNCAEQLILCEGYMDVIALHAAGFPSAVATLGTAITPEQARIMAKYSKKVIISYDSDGAGQKAADKAIRLLSDAGCETKVLRMIDAKDPDEYIKKFGAEKFRGLLSGSRSRFDFKLDSILSQHDIKDPEERIKVSHELCLFVSEIYSEVEREVYIGRIAEVLSLPAESVRSDVKKLVSKRIKEQKREETKTAHLTGYGDRINPDSLKNIRAAKAEETVLGLLLNFAEHRLTVFSGRTKLDETHFFTGLGKRIFAAIRENTDESGSFDISLIAGEFTAEEMGRITRMQISRNGLSVNDGKVLEAAAAVLREEKEKSNAGNSVDDILSLIEKKKEKGNGK